MTAETPGATIERPALAYGSFTIERRYAHKPERVFRAFEDLEAHYRWFVSGEGWEIDRYTHDFRVGGREGGTFRPTGASFTVGNDTWYLEILKAQRIALAYTMTMDGKPISHSLSTIEFFPDGASGCRLVYTEQGAYFGGPDDIPNRKAGSEGLFDNLEIELRAHP